MSRKRPLTRNELDLWRRATVDVRPLADMPPGEHPSPERAKPKAVETVKRKRTTRPTHVGTAKKTPPAPHRALDPAGPIDVDRRSWERLRRGQLSIERTLDLHGRTQTEAHGALNHFIMMASAANLRCVLVVTGKGGPDGRGILRQAEATHRKNVLTYCPAQPRHGGDGALYVLLRRRRHGNDQ